MLWYNAVYNKTESCFRATLQALDILSKAQSYLGIDPDILSQVKTWVHSRQTPEGGLAPCSMEDSLDNVTEMNKQIQATAETLGTLITVGVETDVSPTTSCQGGHLRH